MENNLQTRQKQINRVTIVCLIGNILLTIFKFIAGFVGLSAAMVADAVHSLSDLLTDAIVLVGVHLGVKPADQDHPYGHGRFETFAAMIISIALILVAVFIFINGLKSIISVIQGNIIQKPGIIALIMAAVSIIAKELMYQYTVYVGKKVKSMAVISNAWHHRSDAFSSIATLIGIGGAVLLGNKWVILDPIAALLVSVFIVIIGIKIAKTAYDEMMDKALPEEDIEKIKDICLKTKGVKNPHDIKTRKIGFRLSINLHIDIDKDTSFIEVHNMTSEIEKNLKNSFDEEIYINIHPEPV